MHRVYPRRPACGQIARGGSNQKEQAGRRQQQRIVGRGELEKHGAECPRGAKRRRGAQQRASQDKQPDIAHNHAGDGGAFRAERQADADFLRAALYRVADDTVDPNRGQRQGEYAKTSGEQGQKLFIT